LTDVGLLRERNEDSLLLAPQHRFAAVADGMGGHLSGDVASSLAVTTLEDFYSNTVGPDRTWPFPYDQELSEEENCVVTAVRLANRQVFTRARQSRAEAGMGTTIVALMFTADSSQVVIGHVGDSRCYRVRDGKIVQLTNDHSLVSEVAEIAPWLSEEEVRELPTNVITRALGMAPDVVVDLLTTTTRPGDRYLLCSDGLNGMLSDEEILETVLGGTTLEEVCASLVEKANAAGGADNTTVVLAEVVEREEEAVQPEKPTAEQTLDPLGLEETSMDDSLHADGAVANEDTDSAPPSAPPSG
jgi:protein phosphatase